MSKKSAVNHPFQKQEPKPTRARLVSLLDPLGRKRYAEVERFLATINGATSGLHYFENGWGWAVRYTLGSKDTLCTIHLLPNTFEATVAIASDAEFKNDTAVISPELRRRIGRTRPTSGFRQVRMPIRSDGDYANFQTLTKFKVESLLAAKAKPKKAAKGAAAESGVKTATATAKPSKSGMTSAVSLKKPMAASKR